MSLVGTRPPTVDEWGIALSVSAVVNVGCDYAAKYFGGAIAKMIERAFVPYFIWFLLGCFIYHKRDVLILRLRIKLFRIF